MWELILDENASKVKPEVQQSTLKRLYKLMEHYTLRTKRYYKNVPVNRTRNDLIGWFIGIITNGHSVLQSLKLLREIIGEIDCNMLTKDRDLCREGSR